MELIDIKNLLYQQSCKLVAERISTIRTALTEAQDAANNETKSSAGDKHETGRAMAQLETEKLSTQLLEALKLGQSLNQINPDVKHSIIGLGSLVITNNGAFYVSVGLGKIEFDGSTYFAISSISPIGKLLVKKKEKESFSFNGQSYFIEKVV